MFRGILFRSYYSLSGRGAILKNVHRVDQLHYASRAELDELSRQKLAGLLSHAKSTVPYYRDLLKGSSEVRPEKVLEVLRTLPQLTKQIIRKETDALTSEKPGLNVRWNTSGGSTGEPIRLRQDQGMAHEHRASEIMYLRWAGHRYGDRHLLIWGVPQATVGKGVTFHERLFRFVCNETYFNCYQITDGVLDDWIEQIKSRPPAMIEAYVDAMVELSRRVLKVGAKMPRPRGIITSAGVLTDSGRAAITEAFGAPIFNRYGSREVANLACSCAKSHELHLNEPWCYLEIVDDDDQPCAKGQEGDILVTLYANRTMPLIRYRIEDRGVWGGEEQCACGRTTRRIATIAGRTSDYLVAADGSKINGTALTTLLYAITGIQRFQYRQDPTGKVTLTAVPQDFRNGERLSADLAKPASDLERLLKGRPVEVRIASEIMPSNSGKYRYIINDLKGNGIPVEPARS